MYPVSFQIPKQIPYFLLYGGTSYSRAKLNKELPNRVAVIHCVKSSNLVDAHRGHLEQAGDLVHDTDAGEAVLALAQVQQGHDGGLFVLRRVAGDNLFDELVVLFGELEGDRGVVLGGVAVLCGSDLLAFLSICVQLFDLQHAIGDGTARIVDVPRGEYR
jgi:hypothetical protein